MWIEGDGRRFEVPSMYFRHSGYSPRQLLTAVRLGVPVVLWVTDPTSATPNVRGIESALVRSGPETGVAAEAENLGWLLALALGFTGLGAVNVWWGRGLHPSAT